MKKLILLLSAAVMALCLVACSTENAPQDSEHTHVYSERILKATCTENGYTFHECSCGDSYVTDKVSAGHVWGEWNTTQELSCTQDAVSERKCTVCGTTETNVLNTTGHKYEKEVTAATCTENGYTTYTCSVCNDSYVDNVTTKTGHIWNSGSEGSAPTLTSNGTILFTCNQCNAEKSETITFTDKYSYLAGSVFRSVKEDYHTATANYAYVSAYKDINDDVVVLVYLNYQIISNYTCITLFNLTDNITISEPVDYYGALADRYFGNTSLHYMDLAIEVLEELAAMSEACINILESGNNTGTGTFVYSDMSTMISPGAKEDPDDFTGNQNGANNNDFVGSTVVLYNPGSGTYVTENQSWYTTVLDKTKYTFELTSSQSEAVELKIISNGKAFAFMTDDGRYLSCDGFSLNFTTSQSEYTQFVLEETDGGYFIRCYSATYDGVTPEYLDVYNDRLSCYSMQYDAVWQYVFQLKKVS